MVPLLVAGAGAALLPMRQAMEARRRGATLRLIDPPPARDIYAITASGTLTPPTKRFLDLSIADLQRWHRSVRARMEDGKSLLDAAVEADDVLEAAYRRLAVPGPPVPDSLPAEPGPGSP